MSFPRYPEYKRASAEWLMEVPAHWSEARLRWLAEIYAGGTPDKGEERYWEDGSIPWLNSGSVNEDTICSPSKMITKEGLSASSAKWIPADSLVLALAGQGSTKGKVAHLRFRATCNQSMAAIVPLHALHSRYLYWWLKSAYQRIRNLAGGDLRDGLNLEMIGSIGCPVPPRIEQSSISDYLDHETAKIDALIEEQRSLIELLKEKRQAVISHAVTKGLDPNVPMEDSGVEWLGEVPAHWEVVAIKWLSRVLRGASPRPIDDPQYFDDEGEYGWVRIADVTASSGELESTTQTLSKTGSELSAKLEPGSLFISIAGTVGKPCITRIRACIHDGFVYLPDLEIDPKYVYHIFEAGLCYQGLGKMGTQLNLNTDTIGSIKVAVPGCREVGEIVDSLRLNLAQIDRLKTEAEEGITLLQERRSALISAAVTGKIDFRGWSAGAEREESELALVAEQQAEYSTQDGAA